MAGRKVVVYYAWSRPGEIGAPLEVIENRFPTLFESRRMVYPRFEEFTDPEHRASIWLRANAELTCLSTVYLGQPM